MHVGENPYLARGGNSRDIATTAAKPVYVCSPQTMKAVRALRVNTISHQRLVAERGSESWPPWLCPFKACLVPSPHHRAPQPPSWRQNSGCSKGAVRWAGPSWDVGCSERKGRSSGAALTCNGRPWSFTAVLLQLCSASPQ